MQYAEGRELKELWLSYFYWIQRIKLFYPRKQVFEKS